MAPYHPSILTNSHPNPRISIEFQLYGDFAIGTSVIRVAVGDGNFIFLKQVGRELDMAEAAGAICDSGTARVALT
jgi:hypothetical protein